MPEYLPLARNSVQCSPDQKSLEEPKSSLESKPIFVYVSGDCSPVKSSLLTQTTSLAAVSCQSSMDQCRDDSDETTGCFSGSQGDISSVTGPSPFISAIQDLSKNIGKECFSVVESLRNKTTAGQGKFSKTAAFQCSRGVQVLAKMPMPGCSSVMLETSGSLVRPVECAVEIVSSKGTHDGVQLNAVSVSTGEKDKLCSSHCTGAVSCSSAASVSSALSNPEPSTKLISVASNFQQHVLPAGVSRMVPLPQQQYSAPAYHSIQPAPRPSPSIKDTPGVHVPPIMQIKEPPPAGFKIGYKLAYVPVLVPDTKYLPPNTVLFDWMKRRKRVTSSKEDVNFPPHTKRFRKRRTMLGKRPSFSHVNNSVEPNNGHTSSGANS